MPAPLEPAPKKAFKNQTKTKESSGGTLGTLSLVDVLPLPAFSWSSGCFLKTGRLKPEPANRLTPFVNGSKMNTLYCSPPVKIILQKEKFFKFILNFKFILKRDFPLLSE